MFSTGHLLWIAVSAALILGGLIAVKARKPDLRQVLKACLIVGAASEAVKVFSVMNILPMVTPAVAGGEIAYIPAGQYSPYIEMAHLPLELCSLMLVFLAAALLLRDGIWRERLLTVMYITGLIGGLMGIFLAYITSEFFTVEEYFTSPRVWQYFLYHAMVVFLGLYLGFVRKNDISLRSLKTTMLGIMILDIPTFYGNSIFSQPVYANEKPVGLVYRTNFFSSYVNSLGLVLSEKWQWMAYLAIRLALATALIALMLWLPSLRKKN
jgi:uncharacterized membrane protein YwaF